MVYVKCGGKMLDGFYVKEYPRFGNRKHWCSGIFGPRYSYTKAPGPQALMGDMEPGEIVRPHFHRGWIGCRGELAQGVRGVIQSEITERAKVAQAAEIQPE